MILDNIEDKVVKKELIRQEKKKYKRESILISVEKIMSRRRKIKAKQFFDESSIKKTFKKNNDKLEKNSGNKKKLEKRSFQNDSM